MPRLIVVAGPAGVGKGTVLNRVRELRPDLWSSVSVTTRSRRPGEVDGVHYHFVSDETFDQMVEHGELLEWAVVHRAARYGTPRPPVVATLEAGRDALLEIDMEGARQVRAAMPEACFVFLDPPSWEELVRRLVGRGTESPEQCEARLQTARAELAERSWFDHIIVNDDVERAARDLVEWIDTEQAPA